MPTLLDGVLAAQRASGGMIAAAPVGALTDSGALPLMAGLGAEPTDGIADGRAKRVRARIGAGLSKVKPCVSGASNA